MTVCLCDHTFAGDAALTSVLLDMRDQAQATDRPVHQFLRVFRNLLVFFQCRASHHDEITLSGTTLFIPVIFQVASLLAALPHPGHIVIYAPGDSLPCRRDAS
ncbi:hypothetical protein [Photorhabdus africana]|uniref:hypothetical protein n=1 Tax=Photorhabdus africana TaxID=3097554 RepID=UPI002B409C02|nr:hypothetical protein [Photorhabdus sp. CRI-LC]